MITFSEGVSIWLSQLKETTARTYRRRIKRCLDLIGRDMPLTEITIGDIHRYARLVRDYTFERNGEQHHYSPRTIAEEFNTVKVFFSWCKKNELIEKSPATILIISKDEMSNSTRNKAMSDEDLEILLAFTQNMPREHALIRFQSEAATRTGELISLRTKNISLTEPRNVQHPVTGELVEIYTAIVNGKTGERVVGFFKTAAQALRLWLMKRPVCNHDYCFVTNRGNPLTARYVNQLMKRLAIKIDKQWDKRLVNTNIYSFRHRMGHVMGDANTALPLISAKLGHKSPNSTMHYLPNDAESAWVQSASTVVEPDKHQNKDIIDLTKIIQNSN